MNKKHIYASPNRKRLALLVYLVGFFASGAMAQTTAITENIRLITVAPGWAKNSINTVVFRKNSLATYQDTQFIAFYNPEKYMILGKRKLGSEAWTLHQTKYQGNAADAHNSISIMVDGEGYLHVAWDHHNNPLRYSRSVAPGSLELTDKMPMTGKTENSVSYPEFYKFPNGDLLFLYRDGGSGRGNLVMNKYDLKTRRWTQLHTNLLDGENQRNAYWQACLDEKGVLHISWVWRETWDVATNHDLCYARSADGGLTWEKSNGEKYSLPITAATAEYACKIPQNSELINQTSMTTDKKGNPVIAAYWRERDSDIPQYHVVYLRRGKWNTINMNFRETPFSLSGGGTKKIPIARPQILVAGKKKNPVAYLIFRDLERGNKISAAICKLNQQTWRLVDLSDGNYESWEPTYDTELWKEKGVAHLFVQKVVQVDSEGQADIPAQPIKVLEWKPE